jgi:hypothetical protein
VDWPSVFEEAHPEPGASEAVIAQFVAQIRHPLSDTELREINAGQSNPFPPRDPLYAAWRPLDATSWTIPQRPLPPTYLSLLRWSNGGEFRTGERWFGFFPAIDDRCGVRAMLLAYQLPEYMPGAVPIAFDGGGTFYLLDMREPAEGDEYPVVCAHSGYLSWEPDAHWMIGESFIEACRGKVSVDQVRWQDGTANRP